MADWLPGAAIHGHAPGPGDWSSGYGWPVARLTQAAIEAEIADQSLGQGKRLTSPMTASTATPVINPIPGTLTRCRRQESASRACANSISSHSSPARVPPAIEAGDRPRAAPRQADAALSTTGGGFGRRRPCTGTRQDSD